MVSTDGSKHRRGRVRWVCQNVKSGGGKRVTVAQNTGVEPHIAWPHIFSVFTIVVILFVIFVQRASVLIFN